MTSSPDAHLWHRFKRSRLGFASLIVFLSLYGVSLIGELISNDRPLVARYDGRWYFPLLKTYPESVFGGQLPIKADYNDPFIREQLHRPGNFAIYPPNPYYYDTLNYFSKAEHFPGPPSRENYLGTDIAGYDIAARLLYGFRVSVTFALALTLAGTVLGILIGAVQGYFGGKVDLFAQRLVEVWGSMPELYLMIILAALFEQSFILLFVLLSLFGWIHLSNYVRDLYQQEGVAGTVHMDHIKQHYYGSHRQINPTGIVPLGPAVNFGTPHDRDRFADQAPGK